MNSGQANRISIVLPVYERLDGLEELLLRFEILARDSGLIPESLIVDDGSSPTVWDQVTDICQRGRGRGAIRLQRNFGQHAAVRAGLDTVDSDLVLVSDSDLVESVEMLPAMVSKIEQGAKVVSLEESVRGSGGFLTKASRAFFYSVRNRVVVGSADSRDMSFVLINREAQNVISNYRDRDLALGSVIPHSGLPVVRILSSAESSKNRSTYSLLKKVGLFVDQIFGSSRLGSTLSIGIALVLLVPILAVAVVLVILRFTAEQPEAGFTGIALISLMGTSINVLLLALVLRLNETLIAEVKGRPPYLISERIGVR